jgi:hypothetical protein
MKRTWIGVWVGLVCLLCGSGLQAQQRATREDQLGKQGRQQAQTQDLAARLTKLETLLAARP